MSLPDRARSGRRPGDRGAVLVHVAIATMGLLAFSALSIDLGTLWVARAQAQNAADAAALSGGVALAYIDETDIDAARAAASAVAQAHTVWGSAVVPGEVTTAVGSCPAGSPGLSGTCMGVVVARNATSGTPLPVFFSRIFGATGNEMRASASAKVMLGNTTSCPRPLAIVDRWNDVRDTTAPIDGAWTSDDTYDRYDVAGNLVPGANDVYDPATATTVGTGWALTHVRPSPSTTFRVPIADAAPALPLGADEMLSIDLPRPGGHAHPVLRYQENLGSCGGTQLAVGQIVPTVYAHRSYYTSEPLGTLVASDAGAYWDESVNGVRGSAFPVSPRLITIAVLDPDHYSQQDRSSGTTLPALRVRNLVGFFIESVAGGGAAVLVTGRLSRTAGMFSGDVPAITDQASFLRTVALVR